MKLQNIPYDSIIYLIILFLGYMLGGYLLAVYNVNQFILLGTYIVTLRLVQTGSSSISLAIAWLSIWFWGSVFIWVKPISLGVITAKRVALLLLLCWILAIGITFLLTFADKQMYKLGLNRKNSAYGLIIIVWGAMTVGWYVYQ